MTDDSKAKTHEPDGGSPARKRPSIRVAFTNMKVKMPLRRKLYLLFRNNWIKIRTRQDCCGHVRCGSSVGFPHS
jgi:hypothetical protein